MITGNFFELCYQLDLHGGCYIISFIVTLEVIIIQTKIRVVQCKIVQKTSQVLHLGIKAKRYEEIYILIWKYILYRLKQNK